MSKNNKSSNLNKVSHLNYAKIEQDKKVKEDNTESVYKKFCDEYLEEDFEKIKSANLKKIYEDGIELLNNFYITNKTEKVNSFILEIQFITTKINSVIEKRQNKELMKRNKELNKNLSETISRAEKLEKDANDEKIEIKHMKNDIKSIITTILAIVLAFSIIPTAITAITKMNTNYILPFMSSIILFAMFMVIFIYSIYQDRIKTSTWVIFGISIIVCITLWVNAIYKFSDIEDVNKVKELNSILKQSEEEN